MATLIKDTLKIVSIMGMANIKLPAGYTTGNLSAADTKGGAYIVGRMGPIMTGNTGLDFAMELGG